MKRLKWEGQIKWEIN